ncbi:hypothetical protein EVAR_66591_1 [Eumeta japonica]|uniref:Uncharacterized protein n=1 Tax=Eumeta variegata TaxID=151549 RepID=A0A4C1ZRQ5_EUMVA|nr:hypothetical protein EVAR_66591_1 [Eumeta japonica]
MDASQAECLGRLSIACSALSLSRSAQAERDNESYFFMMRLASICYFICYTEERQRYYIRVELFLVSGAQSELYVSPNPDNSAHQPRH